MTHNVYKNDLPDGLDLGPMVAIDCETMGLNPHRDRLCVVQLSGGDGNAHLVQIAKGQTEQVLAHQRPVAGVQALVIPSYGVGGGAEGLFVEIGQDRIGIGARVPHQPVGQHVPAPMEAPVVAALAVEALSLIHI